MANPTVTLGSSTSSNSFTKPTTATGDYLVIVYQWFNDTNSVAGPPSGWTQIFSVNRTSGASAWFGESCFIRKVDGGEGAGPYSVIPPAGSVFFGGGGIFRVQACADPPNDDTGNAAGTGTAATTGAIVDTVGAEDVCILSAICNGSTFTTPAGLDTANMTSQWSLDGADARCYTESYTASHAGATLASTVGASVDWILAYVTLKPATASSDVLLRDPKTKPGFRNSRGLQGAGPMNFI